MTLALVGTGQMGRAVARRAEQEGYEIAARFDSGRPLTDAGGPDALEGADVAVDFSLPDVALDHIERYCRWQQPAVIGTTGWYDDIDTVKGWAQDSGEGRWTVHEAIDQAVPLPVISAALYARFASRQEDSPAMRAVAMLRHQFGGHEVVT